MSKRVGVQEQESQHRVQVSDDVERIQRKVGGAVVLPVDLDRFELGVGRRGAVERKIDDRDVEAREPLHQAAVGHIGVTGQDEVDIGSCGSRRILLGERLLLHVHDACA